MCANAYANPAAIRRLTAVPSQAARDFAPRPYDSGIITSITANAPTIATANGDEPCRIAGTTNLITIIRVAGPRRAGRHGVLVDADPVALRNVQRTHGSDRREQCSVPLLRSVEDPDLCDPADVGCRERAGHALDLLGDRSDGPDRAELPGTADPPVRPQECEADHRRNREDDNGQYERIDEV